MASTYVHLKKSFEILKDDIGLPSPLRFLVPTLFGDPQTPGVIPGTSKRAGFDGHFCFKSPMKS